MRIKFFVLFIILSGCSTGFKYLNAYDNYNGQPYKVEMTTYRIEYNDSVLSQRLAYKLIDFFDSEGRKIKTLFLPPDGTPSSGGMFYEYDEHGNRTKIVQYNKDGTVDVESNLRYNRFGKLIEKKTITGDIKAVTKHFYNTKKRTERILGKSNGSFRENSIRKYNPEWQEIELISYDKEGELDTRIEFGYDEQGNKNLYKWYSSDNELVKISRTRFNEHKDPVVSRGYRIAGGDTVSIETSTYQYQYGDKGNILEQKLFSDGTLTWITRYAYEF